MRSQSTQTDGVLSLVIKFSCSFGRGTFVPFISAQLPRASPASSSSSSACSQQTLLAWLWQDPRVMAWGGSEVPVGVRCRDPPLKMCWKPGPLHQPPALLASPIGGAPMLWHVPPACGDAGEQWGGSAGPDLAGNPAHIAGKEHGEVGTLEGLKKGGWFLPCDLPGGFSGEGGQKRSSTPRAVPGFGSVAHPSVCQRCCWHRRPNVGTDNSPPCCHSSCPQGTAEQPRASVSPSSPLRLPAPKTGGCCDICVHPPRDSVRPTG